MRWFFAAMFGGLGLMLLYVGVTQFFLQRRLAANAQPVEAEIIRSDVTKSVSADTDRSPSRNTSTTTYSPNVRFRYLIDGVARESDMLRPTVIGSSFASYDEAAKELEPFPLGARVVAYVDEKRPDKGFLILEKGAGPLVS